MSDKASNELVLRDGIGASSSSSPEGFGFDAVVAETS